MHQMESESSTSSNSTGGGDPVPHPPPPLLTQQFLGEGTPLRRRGRANLGPGQLRLAGSTPSTPRAIRPLAVVPPVMGVPGVSTSSPLTRPPPTTSSGGFPGLAPFTFFNRAPPLPHWRPGAGPSRGPSGPGFGYGFGLYSGHLLPAGGRGYGAGLRMGGNPGTKKRFREDRGAGDSGKQPGEGSANVYTCPICGREFMSEKALFGHMRSHPNRGWKGVHPPPAFRADEEFADVPGLNRPEGIEAAGVEEGEVVAQAPAAEGDGDVEMQPQGAEEENYVVPDLNMPPPPSPDQ